MKVSHKDKSLSDDYLKGWCDGKKETKKVFEEITLRYFKEAKKDFYKGETETEKLLSTYLMHEIKTMWLDTERYLNERGLNK